MSELKCVRLFDGIGVDCETQTPITELQAFALHSPNFSFDDAEDLASQQKWNEGIANKDIFIVNKVISQESIKVEDGKYTSPFGQIVRLWEGMRGLALKLLLTLDQHRILRTYGKQSWRLIRLDRSNKIVACRDSVGKCMGFSLATFEVEGQTEATAAEPPLTPVTFQEEDPGEYNSEGIWIEPTWRIKNLQPLSKVTLTCSVVAAFVFTATVKKVAVNRTDSDGTAYEVAVSGLTEDSFAVIDQTGAVEPVTVVETSVPGVYTVTGVNITSGSCTIVPVADYAIPATPVVDLYESATVTLSA